MLFNTLTACSMISGPMPSPGKIAIFMSSSFQSWKMILPARPPTVARRSQRRPTRAPLLRAISDGVSQPRLVVQVALFEGADFVRLAQGQTDVIKAIE